MQSNLASVKELLEVFLEGVDISKGGDTNKRDLSRLGRRGLEYSFGELNDHVNLIREGIKYKDIHCINIQGQKNDQNRIRQWRTRRASCESLFHSMQQGRFQIGGRYPSVHVW